MIWKPIFLDSIRWSEKNSVSLIFIFIFSANVESVDVMGNDACMYAPIFGRPKNIQCWLERVKDWDLNRQNTVVGGCALGNAVYMGANKLQTVKTLLNAGASLDYRTFVGSNVLTNAVENEDSDPEFVRVVLEKMRSSCSPKEFARQLPLESIDTQVENLEFCFEVSESHGTFEVRTDVYHVIVARNNSIEFCCDER